MSNILHVRSHMPVSSIYLIISMTTWTVTIDIYMETIPKNLAKEWLKERMIVFQKYFYFSNKMEIILVTRISTLYFLFNPCLREQSKTKRILNYSGLAESWWCIKTLAVIFKSKWTKATIHHKNIMINAFNSALTVWTEFFFLLPMEKGFDINQTAVLTIGPHLNSEYWAYSKSKSNSL